MAKKSMIAREKKRRKLSDKYAKQRLELKGQIADKDIDISVRMDAVHKLSSLPRNSSKVRTNSRCSSCGRPRSVYRRFNLCRICIRLNVVQGFLPGMKKSSW